MKKAWALLLALALLIACGAALAEEEKVAMRIVTCEEQGFSTLCKPEYDYDFTPDGGVTIALGAEIGDPWVSVFKTDAPGADFDAEYYLANIYSQQIAGSADQVVNAGEVTEITLGGKTLTALMTLYVTGGESRYSICAYDRQPDYFVRYEARCAGEDIAIEDALKALAVAAGNFQPDANYYSH